MNKAKVFIYISVVILFSILIVTFSGCSIPTESKIYTTTTTKESNQNIKWSLYWTPNYLLSFEPGKWKIEYDNEKFASLIFLSDRKCKIIEPGPMGFPEDYSKEIIGSITYETVNRLNIDEPFMGYMARNEIDSETQNHPFFFVYVPKSENCISEAKKVLSTLSKK